MKTKLVDCMEWKAPNKPGELARCVKAFKKNKVNLDVLWSCGASGDIGACAKRPAKLRAALKEAGIQAGSSKCFYLAGKDKTGALTRALGKLAKAGVNVDYCSAVAGKGGFGCMIYVDDRDIAKARKALGV